MARVAMPKPQQITDPAVEGIFAWVTEMEGSVPNHFYVELNFPEFFTAKLGATKVLWEMGELTMEEIQHVGIVVSQANGCPYCTAAFCTILNHGLGTAEDYVAHCSKRAWTRVEGDRLRACLSTRCKSTKRPAERQRSASRSAACPWPERQRHCPTHPCSQ